MHSWYLSLFLIPPSIWFLCTSPTSICRGVTRRSVQTQTRPRVLQLSNDHSDNDEQQEVRSGTPAALEMTDRVKDANVVFCQQNVGHFRGVHSEYWVLCHKSVSWAELCIEFNFALREFASSSSNSFDCVHLWKGGPFIQNGGTAHFITVQSLSKTVSHTQLFSFLSFFFV